MRDKLTIYFLQLLVFWTEIRLFFTSDELNKAILEVDLDQLNLRIQDYVYLNLCWGKRLARTQYTPLRSIEQVVYLAQQSGDFTESEIESYKKLLNFIKNRRNV